MRIRSNLHPGLIPQLNDQLNIASSLYDYILNNTPNIQELNDDWYIIAHAINDVDEHPHQHGDEQGEQ